MSKRKSRKKKAKVKVLKPVKLARNEHIVPIVIVGPPPPEVSTWRAFVNWLESFTS